jgi:CRP/FNR family transcriptional regulator, cyclic AMP receptor protein
MSIAASLDFGSRSHKTSPAGAPELVALGRVPVLAGLSVEAQSALAMGATIRRFARRDLLAPEGKAPTHIFAILEGRVRAVRRSPSGREVTLETFQSGDLLADGAVVPERQLLNDWEACEPTEVLALTRQVFVGQLQAVPTLALTVAAQMLVRLERSKNLAAGLALADVPGRVIGALRGLAQAGGQSGPDGVVVHNRPTQQEIANSIGACRETVSRIVSDLARRGLITPRGRTLIISQRLMAMDCAT